MANALCHKKPVLCHLMSWIALGLFFAFFGKKNSGHHPEEEVFFSNFQLALILPSSICASDLREGILIVDRKVGWLERETSGGHFGKGEGP